MDLKPILDEALSRETDHTRRLLMGAAVVSEALRREGLEATVVGGAAIEIHAPDVYHTSDIDLVVSGRFGIDWDAAQKRAFLSLGFERRHRHWVRDDLFFEIPGRSLSDRFDAVSVGALVLHVVAKEVVVADRIVGFRHWGVTDYGMQAVLLLSAFGPELDEALLRAALDRESAWDAYEVLRALANEAEPVSRERVESELRRLQRPGGRNEH